MAKNKTKKNPSTQSRKNMTSMDVRKAKRDTSRFEFLSVENEPVMIKKKGFLNNNLYIVLAFIIPFLLMYLAYAFHKCQPFGDQQILVTDLWHQYFPFLVDYQDKLKHGESLFWSWTQGGGTNY